MDPANKYFHCTDRERAIFEAGIKLGAIFHQYTGIPVNKDNVNTVKKAIEDSTRIQPFVENIDVNINIDNNSSFNYLSLNCKMLDVKLTIKYKNQEVKARMMYIEELNYPLMYLEE